MTTAENLNRIINAKSDIKQAIEKKGVEVGDITIDKYAEKVKQITPKVVLRDGTKFRSSTFIFDALDEPMTSMFDTSQMTDMSYMFDDCENFFGVILEKWDFSNVTNMSNMFSNCGSLMYIKLNNNFNKVTNMSSMFENCRRLTDVLGLEDWDTSNVTDMSYMFYGCKSLVSLDLSKWDTSNVTNMTSMFYDCKSLVSLDLTNWDTSNVTTMDHMFEFCSNLTELRMGGDVSKVTDVDYMFQYVITTGAFYYNPKYDYSKIIAQLPSKWVAIPREDL